MRESISKYSCLMSVYYAENAEYLDMSIKSMENQTLPPSEFVVVIDGPISRELEQVLDSHASGDTPFNFVRFSENRGLHEALRAGVIACKYELIARMDTDDISEPVRMEKQIDYLISHCEYGAVGCLVDEFDQFVNEPIAQVSLPETNDEIVAFAKKRNPCRHPAMLMRKSWIVKAGNYQRWPYFEDYDLFVRMMQSGCLFYNIQEVLVHMRVSKDFYKRRGGISYLKSMLAFKTSLKNSGFISFKDFVISAGGHALVCIAPNSIRAGIYKLILRNR